MRHPIALLVLLVTSLTACDIVDIETAPPPQSSTPAAKPTSPKAALPPRQAAAAFVQVKRRMEPIAEAECRARTRGTNCDYRIVVDDDPEAKPNAFQTVDKSGRPVIAFTMSLIAIARNADEIALVMGHEAAHHIRGHLDRQLSSARQGAIIGAGLATVLGGDAETVGKAYEVGAQYGARRYSKEFELEADQLGTIIALKSGYDPVRGSQFLNQLPDPGNKYLGTHPPHAQRLQMIRDTAAGY